MKTSSPQKYVSKSMEETAGIAVEFLMNLQAERSGATIYGLKGDLGSGKTAFTKEAASILGIKKEGVTSPTFVIEKIYAINHPHFSHFIHIDAYRLEKPHELVNLGWKEIIEDKNNLIFLEWPEKVESILPKNTRIIEFKFIDENTREINFL